MQAEMLNITVGQLLDIKPMSPLREEEIKRKYGRGQPLVEPEEVKNLPTRMYELHHENYQDFQSRVPHGASRGRSLLQ